MTAFIVSSIATMLLLLLAQVLLNWQLCDVRKQIDRQTSRTSGLECDLLELERKVYKLEKKGGAE